MILKAKLLEQDSSGDMALLSSEGGRALACVHIDFFWDEGGGTFPMDRLGDGEELTLTLEVSGP